MKAIERHLYSRNGHFYYRSALPRHLLCILPFKEVVIALGSQDLGEARLMAVRLNYDETKLLRSLQNDLRALSPDQSPEPVIEQFLNQIVSLKGTVGYKPPVGFESANGQGKKRSSRKVLFSEIVKKYLEDCSSDAAGTRFHKETTFELFRQVKGDMPFVEINAEDARQFKSCLMKIPANAKKLLNIASFEGLDLDKITVGKPQHSRTINSRIATLIALFNWAERAGYSQNKNPFTSLIIRGQKGLSSRRHPFNSEEVQVLFRCPVFTGCLADRWSDRLLAGNHVIRDSLYWIPLIGLYSGMRMNEICQLHTEDIRKDNGIFLFDINDDKDDKALKTTSSRRIVPVHAALIDRGLLDHAIERKDREGLRLFPDVPMGARQSYSSVFSKRFTRLLKVLDIKKRGLCFHSLRHTFIDGLRNAGVDRAIAMTLTGHQSLKDVHDSYGKGYNLAILQESINKLSFPEIEG